MVHFFLNVKILKSDASNMLMFQSMDEEVASIIQNAIQSQTQEENNSKPASHTNTPAVGTPAGSHTGTPAAGSHRSTPAGVAQASDSHTSTPAQSSPVKVNPSQGNTTNEQTSAPGSPKKSPEKIMTQEVNSGITDVPADMEKPTSPKNIEKESTPPSGRLVTDSAPPSSRLVTDSVPSSGTKDKVEDLVDGVEPECDGLDGLEDLDGGEALGGMDANDDNICRVCSEKFKQPRVLGCLHVFCTPCLEKQLEKHGGGGEGGGEVPKSLTCPRCEQLTPLAGKKVEDLPLDTVMVNILDLSAMDDQLIVCTSCKAKEKAVARCNDCASFLCPNCVTAHQYMRCFENHKVCVCYSCRIFHC